MSIVPSNSQTVSLKTVVHHTQVVRLFVFMVIATMLEAEVVAEFVNEGARLLVDGTRIGAPATQRNNQITCRETP